MWLPFISLYNRTMLTRLKLLNYRSYPSADFTFSSGATAIIGLNGSGKTNLLEAVYVLSRQKSFRSPLRTLIKHDQEYFRIDGQADDHLLSFRYNPHSVPQKDWRVDVNKQKPRKEQLPSVVLFEPDFLRFITGSPTRRREYLDELMTAIFPTGAATLRRYNRVLLQRNNLLKQNDFLDSDQRDQLFVWNIMLSELAAQIDARRLQIVGHLNSRMSELYSNIASKSADVRLDYELSYEPTQAKILSHLQHREARDLLTGHTSIGPHRNDISVYLNEEPAEETASRGEQRSIAIGLKLIELQQQEATSGKSPILLLDDVLSELDAVRQEKLLELIGGHQTLITDTDAKHVRHLSGVNFINL